MPACQLSAGTDVPRDAFVRAMRMVASSVTVVTTDGPSGRHGATVSAFTSVSADPPTILVCLRADSRIAQAVEGNGQLCVNVLPSESRAIADRFAGKDDAWLDDRFSGIDCFGRPGAAPQIDGATIFAGSVEQSLLSGSHRIFIIRIATVREGMDQPLTYLDGAYHRVVRDAAPVRIS
ncbi:flavin reductase family protein [Defluviimonas sp. WL0050]|uniref:Flavin reductase family protein n=1 Tax=Albidovulum litorale TaxID=2984134 RepID=A0ABT2ZP15_9RHOB|nr:flavin reductase family protein [Defluviimonas sp. WL0050]MCV2872491.1 flavin reductase family protein [Defluviimonas sp. WL0050]